MVEIAGSFCPCITAFKRGPGYRTALEVDSAIHETNRVLKAFQLDDVASPQLSDINIVLECV